MKRHLSVGEGYAPKLLNFKPLPHHTCSMKNASRNQKIGWLVMPMNWAKVTGFTGLVALFFLCLSVGSASAQDSDSQLPDSIQPITAGMRLPEEFWTTEFQFYDHEKVYTQTLEQYKGKPIILGFWSVHCGGCLASFPFLREMSLKYPKDLVIIPVNYQLREDPKRIENHFKRMREGDHYRIPTPTILYDDYLKHVFPHGPIPHYIWIQSDGKVGGVTQRTFLNEANIINILNQ